MKTVDARGKACPQPVIMTKKEADAGEENIMVIVDNDTAKSNVLKLGAKLNFACSVEEKADGTYIAMVRGSDLTECETTLDRTDGARKKGFVFGTNILGKGSDELGAMLMKGFIYTITETKPYPEFMIFLNSGVKLTTEGSVSLDDLKKLESAGVRILSCGTCLDYYELKEKLKVGQVSNMYDIVEAMTESGSTIMID